MDLRGGLSLWAWSTLLGQSKVLEGSDPHPSRAEHHLLLWLWPAWWGGGSTGSWSPSVPCGSIPWLMVSLGGHCGVCAGSCPFLGQLLGTQCKPWVQLGIPFALLIAMGNYVGEHAGDPCRLKNGFGVCKSIFPTCASCLR